MNSNRFELYNDFATRFYEDVLYERSLYYYFLGRTYPWDDDCILESGDVAINPTCENEAKTKDDIFYIKKIQAKDTSLVIRKIPWENGKVFDQWDHTIEMDEKDYYCVNSQFGVYKCLNNNNGAASIYEPTETPFVPFYTDDGYLWKYMYSIPQIKRYKFIADEFIPVQKSITDSFYNKGAVDEVVVLNGGSGYSRSSLSEIIINENGCTVGSGAEAHITSVDENGTIESIDVVLPANYSTDSPEGLFGDSPILTQDSPPEVYEPYIAGCTITINPSDSPGGFGAEIEPIISEEGILTGVNIINGGYGYKTTDTVLINTGRASLFPVVSSATGSILDVIIDDPGSGYVIPPTLSISPTNGNGIYGNTEAVLKAIIHEGKIVRVVIEDPGRNYLTDESTTIVVTGDGTGGQFQPVILPETGEIISVLVEDPGINYTYMNLSVVGDGTGASLSAIVGDSDFQSNQSIIEQTAVKGAIYSIKVTEGGNNYSPSSTKVRIEGDGRGCTAIAVLNEDSIEKIDVVTFGEGYTYANVFIEDSQRGESELFTDASAYAILPPLNGHGFDAPYELGSTTTAINVDLRESQDINEINPNYRQFGIIKNPLNIFTRSRITASDGIIDFELTLKTVENLEVNDILLSKDDGVRYRIINIDEDSKFVRLQQLSSIYKTPGFVYNKEGDTSVVNYEVNSFISTPEIDKYSGKMIFVFNKEIFSLNPNQSVLLRTYITAKQNENV